MVQKNVALAAAAAFVIGMSSVSAAPMAGHDNELYGRADKVPKVAAELAKKFGKDAAHGSLVDAATDKIKSWTKKETPVDPAAAAAADAAIKKMTSPFNPALVNAVVNPPKKGQSSGQKKTRDLSDLYYEDLFTRAFEEELYARADKIFKVAGKVVGHVVKDTAAGALVDAATDKVKSATQKQQTLDPTAAAAINKMTGPFNPAAVQAATTRKAPPPKKTRDLSDFYDEDLFGRDFDEELYARADKIVKAVAKHLAKDVAHSTVVDAATDKIKGATQKEQPLSAGASAAISKATGPFNPTLVNAAITKKPPPKKTRSFEEFLEARWFGLEDLD